MARMHARRKGKSGSKHPLVSESPAWMPLTATEIEEQIVKMETLDDLYRVAEGVKRDLHD